MHQRIALLLNALLVNVRWFWGALGQRDNRSMDNDVHLYEELKQLRLENARLKEERELLKKSEAFLAKESR